MSEATFKCAYRAETGLPCILEKEPRISPNQKKVRAATGVRLFKKKKKEKLKDLVQTDEMKTI